MPRLFSQAGRHDPNEQGLDRRQQVGFDSKAQANLDLGRGQRLMLGMNTFLPCQAQAAHAHADADKFYLVLKGEAEMTLEGDRIGLSAGQIGWATAGLEHGLASVAEVPLVVLSGVATPPGNAT